MMKEVEQTKTQPETNTIRTQTFSSSSLAIPIRLDWESHTSSSSPSRGVLQVSTTRIRTSTTFSPRLRLLAFELAVVLAMTLTNKLILCLFLHCRQEEEILSHVMISPRHLVVAVRDMLNGPFALL